MANTRSNDERPPSHPILGVLRPTLAPQWLDPLPTTRDVLSHYFYLKETTHVKTSPDTLMRLLLVKVEAFWDRANIPISASKNNKGFKLLKKRVQDVKSLLSHTSRKSNASKTTQFLKSIDVLFDISHSEAEYYIRTCRMRTAAKIDEDLNFLLDQRGPRKFGLGNLDQKFEKRVTSRQKRVAAECNAQVKASLYQISQVFPSDETRRRINAAECETQSDDTSDSGSDDTYTCTQPSGKRIRMESSVNVPGNILKSPKFHQCADRLKLSVRDRTMLLGTIFSTSGDNNLQDVIANKSSSHRAALTSRKVIADDIKNNFKSPVNTTIHFDAKKVIDSSSTDRKKVETLVVSAAGPPDHTEGKLLGTAAIKSKSETGIRMGRSEAMEVNKLCESWQVSENICGMGFDTTSTNTGCENGACTIYESELLKRKILWLACRRHVDEVIISDVWKMLFGSTSSPDNPIFKRFRDDIWDQLITTAPFKTLEFKSRQLKTRRDEVIEFYTQLLTSTDECQHQLPRDDYKECAMVMLQILGVSAPQGIKWYRPGACHEARWMVVILYSAKMFAFSEQFSLEDGYIGKLRRLCVFNALYYAPQWLTSSKGVDAPVNDLLFWKNCMKFKMEDKEIAAVAIRAQERHMWYTTEELAPLCIFSNMISDAEKSQIAKQILKHKCKYDPEATMGQPIFPTVKMTTQLKDLIGPKSWLMFSLFNDADWLKLQVKCWKTDDRFKEMLEFATHLKVVNDLAERKIKLMSDYSTIITNSADQKQCVLQSVEQHRIKVPDVKKTTLMMM